MSGGWPRLDINNEVKSQTLTLCLRLTLRAVGSRKFVKWSWMKNYVTISWKRITHKWPKLVKAGIQAIIQWKRPMCSCSSSALDFGQFHTSLLFGSGFKTAIWSGLWLTVDAGNQLLALSNTPAISGKTSGSKEECEVWLFDGHIG